MNYNMETGAVENVISVPICERVINCDVSEDVNLPDGLPDVRRVLAVKENILSPAKFIGAKALDMSGVNFTAGLRVVRTSPDHGTAYRIAGKNEASETSMLHAIYTAIDVLKTRKQNTELVANQLVVERKEVKREYHVEKFVPID